MDTRTIKTPLDMQIEAEQQRTRIALAAARQTELAKPPVAKQFGESFTFRLRQIRNTQFSGLWELCLLDQRGNVKEVVTDADALTNALETMGNVMEQRGF